MRAQLQRLVGAAKAPNIILRLLPFEVGAHAAMEGTFAILDFREADGQSIAYAEPATGGLSLDKASDLRLYTNIFERIRKTR
jgi:hypothetical protein